MIVQDRPTRPRRAAKPVSRAEPGNPKTTRPPASARREPQREEVAAERVRRKLDATPDRIDIRDFLYQPTLRALPDSLVNIDRVPFVLDQKAEGACTGFALAAVVNFQLAARGLLSSADPSRGVSPRMLYEMARRYDQWPGEEYEGSSARGAIKGWVAHGVARRLAWPDTRHGSQHLTDAVARNAQDTPGGAYYRVAHRNIRDVHAALSETGCIYATLMVHEGWDDSELEPRELAYNVDGVEVTTRLPLIRRKGRADSGHAIALVGYTREGFVVQNSWGKQWGASGFALLPYEDWLLHATDCWVVQLGVPIDVDLWAAGRADTTAGRYRATAAIPLAEIRPYVINIGNNGLLSQTGSYWTTEADLDRLVQTVGQVAGARSWPRRRVMLYLHGGLNDEAAAAKRIVAYRDVCLANQIYPVHVMWETGLGDTLLSAITDLFTDDEDRASADWLRRYRDGLMEARDRTIELTVSRPGAALWSEMKENAQLASARAGGMALFAAKVGAALKKLSTTEQASWELHVVAHSAGSVFAAHAVRHLINTGITFRTLQLLAPSIRTDLFKREFMPAIEQRRCPHPTLYILSDAGERDDNVGSYGKSLLYLVSNALEKQRAAPLLGMERFISRDSADPDKTLVDDELDRFFKRTVDGLPSLVLAGAASTDTSRWGSVSRADTHSGFDNDEATMNSVLSRILGAQPARPFTLRDLQFD